MFNGAVLSLEYEQLLLPLAMLAVGILIGLAFGCWELEQLITYRIMRGARRYDRREYFCGNCGNVVRPAIIDGLSVCPFCKEEIEELF